MKNKKVLKLAIAVILYTAFVACITYVIAINVSDKSTDVTVSESSTNVNEVTEEPEASVEEPEISVEDLKTSEVDSDVTTADLTLSDGSTYTFYIPEGHKYITDNYVANIMHAYDTASEISSDNIIVTGNGDSIFNSVESISATTISSLKQLMYSLYGNDINVDDLAYSEAYTYMKTGEIPDTKLKDYSIEEVNTIVVDDVTYKAYMVSYYMDVEGNGNEDDYVKNEQLMCYSDTDDAIEIIVYTGDSDQEHAMDLLCTFLGV